MTGLLPLLLLTLTGAAPDEAWQTVATGRFTVKSRQLPGTGVRELLAEGDLDARGAALERAITAVDGYARFLPHVKESRFVAEPASDGTSLVYIRVAPPLVSSRDWVARCRTTRTIAMDGEFVHAWELDPVALPARANTVRLQLNSGTWHVTPVSPTRSHVVYRSAIDPGGLVPAFLADLTSTSSVLESLAAMEREAQRLETEATATPPARL